MARYYYLMAVFDIPTAAENCCALFQARTFSLSSGQTFQCASYILTSNNGLSWVFSQPKPPDPQSADQLLVENRAELDEVATLLYAGLAEVEHFLCGMVGWELADLFLPDATCGYSDLRIEPQDFLEHGWSGLVIDTAIWQEIGCPAAFRPFSPGYVWQPYLSLSTNGW